MNFKTKTFMTKKKAFTLIELLIVIAIIGILFIVLVSKVDFATDKAKASGVQTDFRSFQMAFDTVAKENAGFNTFGWDTGDANQNGKRDSYDEGDNGAGGGIAQNGIQDGTEVFTGHKVYAETFTKVFSLKKNGTGSYDREALNRLETAINANLDPKLHITIKDDGEIVMANGARDPWNKEYHGYYISNAETDGKDRGAIIIYSDGANNEFGSAHSIAGGNVSVTIPNSNKNGKDDYSIVSCYTYLNGYGEVLNMTTGFSNNQYFSGNNSTGVITGNNQNNAQAGSITFGDETTLSWEELKDPANGSKYGYNASQISDTEINDAFLGSNIKSIVIPDSITSIGDYAFAACENLESVVIGNGVVEMGQYAFADCINLKSVTFGTDLKSISYYSFSNCTNLTTFIVPEGVTSIEYMAFAGCTNLTSISIPNSLMSIDKTALEDCPITYTEYEGCKYLGKNNNPYYVLFDAVDKDLSTYTIHPDTKIIAGNVLEECYNLTSLDIPYGVISMGDSSFAFCAYLVSINIPNSVTYIGNNAFYCCYALTDIVVPDSVTYIGDEAFYQCYELESITLSNNITHIGRGTFSYCENITNITIPNGVTSIGNNAFGNCENLTKVVIYKSLQTVGDMAFYSCNITDVYYTGSSLQWAEIDVNNRSNFNDSLLNANIHYNHIP